MSIKFHRTLKALETLASTVTTLPSGMALLNHVTDAVTTILLECLQLQYLRRDPYGLIIRQKIIQRICFTWQN
jgi:hypothetical protein